MRTRQRSRAVTTAALALALALGACTTSDEAGDGDTPQGQAVGGPADGTDTDTGADTGTGDAGATAEAAPTGDEPTGDEPTGGSGISLVATSIVGEPAEFSSDLSDPETDRGLIRVDQAYQTDTFGGHQAAQGNDLVVIDYEIAWIQSSQNLFDTAFRLSAGGGTYQPADPINLTGGFGEVLNTNVVFEVPEGITELRFEAGVPAGTVGGLTATFDLTFTEAGPASLVGLGTGTVPADLEATGISGGQQRAATDPGDVVDVADVDVVAARLTARDGELFAHDGTKLVVVDLTLSGFDASANVFHSAFRLLADDEWYPSLVRINETVGPGESLDVVAAFEVPLEAERFTLEVGAPLAIMTPAGLDQHADVPTATWELTFPT